MYMSVVIDGIFRNKAENKKVRQKLFRQQARFEGLYLHQKLSKVDPKAAVKIHPNDIKRIVRALEVFEVTGNPISVLQATRRGLEDKYEINIFGLELPRKKLDQKINQRVDKMFRQGLVNEVKRLLRLKLSKTSRYAIGIKEIKGYLDGFYSLDEARELIKRNTRKYARRQMTWFRKDKRIKWIRNLSEALAHKE